MTAKGRHQKSTHTHRILLGFQHTPAFWCEDETAPLHLRLRSGNDTPGEDVVQLITHVMRNFLRQVLLTVNNLRLHFSNITLDRVDVREPAVTGMELEEHYVVFAS